MGAVNANSAIIVKKIIKLSMRQKELRTHRNLFNPLFANLL
jgi:hypothetical protein